MESDFTPQQALAEAERGAVATWIDYPPTPWWYYPATGAWATALVLAVTALDGLWSALAVLVLVAVEFAFLTWYTRVRRAWPKLTNPPAEFSRAITGYLIGAGALAVLIIVLVVLTGPAAAAPVTFIGVTGGLLWYEKAYERAAARTRRRVEGVEGAA